MGKLKGIDHVTIRTKNLDETKAFFERVFDLEEKTRPRVIQHIPGYWLYKNDEPMVHIIRSYGNPVDYTAEGIDHVGFKMEGYHAFCKKLNQLKIPYSLMDIEEIEERRIFIRTPFHVLLECVFKER